MMNKTIALLLFFWVTTRVFAFGEPIGTINQTPVYPQEIVKTALSHNAAAVVVAHNHPSGVAEPSMADRAIMMRCHW